jgi:hydrogenase nickel incorporation protein HypA/HybF
MHELSIAMSIVEMAQEEAESRGGVQVQAVHLRLGLLSGVVKEALLSSYEMACFATLLEGSQLLIEEVPVEVFCPKCEGPRVVPSIQWMCCPECGTPTPMVLRGKELEVVALELAAPETDGVRTDDVRFKTAGD